MKEQYINLFTDFYRWQNINDIEQDSTVHPNRKVFLTALKQHI